MKVTKRWINQSLQASDQLIKSYKGGTYDASECLFCKLFKETTLQGVNICTKCPWLFFKGKNCSSFNYSLDSFDKRCRRLNGWQRRFNNMIKNKVWRKK